VSAALVAAMLGTAAIAQTLPVALGSAAAFGVLAGSSVTNTGTTTVQGDLGVSPGTQVTGSPVVLGSIHAGDGVAAQAQLDLTIAYNDAVARTGATAIAGDIGGLTLTAGVYHCAATIEITSAALTLDGLGDNDAVFIFQVGSTLNTASSSQVILIGGAKARNVFWQVGSSATLGSNSIFKGNILAMVSISMTTGAEIDGKVLARSGAVSMEGNSVLPVELFALSARIDEAGVRLRWSTRTETNNYGFEIERKLAVLGGSPVWSGWETIGFQSGNGSTSVQHAYEFLDADVLTVTDVVTAAYRLHQVDRDGASAYSAMLAVRFVGPPAWPVLYAPYPSPADQQVVVSFFLPGQSVVSITVHDTFGKEVERLCDSLSLDAGTHTYPCFVNTLAEGVYFVRMLQGTSLNTQKFVVRQ
jgi:hypothetical protein